MGGRPAARSPSCLGRTHVEFALYPRRCGRPWIQCGLAPPGAAAWGGRGGGGGGPAALFSPFGFRPPAVERPGPRGGLPETALDLRPARPYSPRGGHEVAAPTRRRSSGVGRSAGREGVRHEASAGVTDFYWCGDRSQGITGREGRKTTRRQARSASPSRRDSRPRTSGERKLNSHCIHGIAAGGSVFSSRFSTPRRGTAWPARWFAGNRTRPSPGPPLQPERMGTKWQRPPGEGRVGWGARRGGRGFGTRRPRG